MTDFDRARDGRYRIERELGRGGMGAVYLARDLTLDRPVALEVLPPEFARNSSLRERFLRETRTASTGTTGPSTITAAMSSSNGSGGETSLRHLDRRVRELEQWRRSRSGSA